MPPPATQLLAAARTLSQQCDAMRFALPVHTVYNPLDYAWPMFEQYVRRFVDGPRRVVLFGMNPGPWGMAQTGVPFGEVNVCRDWLGLDEPIGRPTREHPKRPVLGLGCPRSEISGQRVWGLIRSRFKMPEAFFEKHYITNFCPLVFMAESGRNLTPDKLPVLERGPLIDVCETHLREVLRVLKPQHLVAVGAWAQQRAKAACAEGPCRVSRILHPSPASPAANRDWAGQVTRQLIDQGVWDA